MLADVLEAARTGGVVFARVRFNAPWRLRCDAAPLAGFHLVARGSCLLQLDSAGEPVPLQSGDVALVTQGAGHDLYSQTGSPVTPLADLIGQMAPRTIGDFHVGADGDETVLVCGGYLFQQPGPHPLLSALPPLVHVRREDLSSDTRFVLDQLIAEVAGRRPGAQTVVNRLVDVLLVHLLRVWIETHPQPDLGWLAGFRDPAVSLALQKIHQDYGSPLGVAELARHSALSESSFKKRFRELVGIPPGEYLSRLRLDRAAGLLRETDQAVGSIAGMVGYTSEYAFNRAFARSRGLSPGRYRAEIRANPPRSPVEIAR